jgi:hypothetical protein
VRALCPPPTRQVKNRSAAPVQITAEQLLREAKDRIETEAKPTVQKIVVRGGPAENESPMREPPLHYKSMANVFTIILFHFLSSNIMLFGSRISHW